MVFQIAEEGIRLSYGQVRYLLGQRFANTSQPELGLGMVIDSAVDSVEIEFAATGEKLRYAAAAAPLRRVKFGLGDEIESWDGRAGTVEEVRETPDGLLEYRIDSGSWIEEADLAAHLSEERHDDALFAGRAGTTQEFALRRRTLRAREKMRSSEVRGLLGAKVDLIPHQLFIAKNVADRSATRVLLADEVGLGKTIEACLIMHRRMISGRVKRVLVLVPEALVHQWFVELLRRFNLQFSIFDEDRCRAIESGGEGTENPFLEEQIVLGSTSWMANAKGRPEQAAAANWDMIVVDEAHHLQWSPEEESADYQLVRQLSEATRDILLLTATPEQLGRDGHFARLQLLDPQRFSNLDDYLKERDNYGEIADLAAEVIEAKKIDESLSKRVGKILGGDSPKQKGAIVDRLIDMHGTGRVMFRNVRSNLGGFPERKAHLIPLVGGDLAPGFGEVLVEDDPRVEWLAGFLKDNPKQKVLVIGSTRELAEGVIEAIQEKVLIKCAIFHEGLTLLQRDRNAAWFAEDEGARVLVCSEIGSEGRNFQFAHDIVLFDLPTRPGLVEQRIGRLDRIGQTETIQIHIPFAAGSAHEGLAQWYQEGCNAFERSLRGGSNVREEFEEKVSGMTEIPAKDWDKIIGETREFVEVLDEKLEEGRDRLLEMASFRRTEAEAVTGKVRDEDEEDSLNQLFVDLCDQLGVAVEPLDATSITMKADTVFSGEAFPGMRDGPTPGTFSRAQALEREEMSFLTWDHPVVQSSMDLLLSGEAGKVSFAVWPQSKDSNMLLELVFVVECLGAASLDLDRFLPPRVVRVLVDKAGNDLAASISGRTLDGVVKDGDVTKLDGERGDRLREAFDQVWDRGHEFAEAHSKKIIAGALASADKTGSEVLNRLESLKNKGNPVPEAERLAAEHEAASLENALNATRLRLDCARLVLIGGAAESFVIY